MHLTLIADQVITVSGKFRKPDHRQMVMAYNMGLLHKEGTKNKASNHLSNSFFFLLYPS